MDQESKDFIRLLAMAPVRNGENSESNEMEIGGVNVSEYMPNGGSHHEDTLLTQFARGEISYNEFMRLGGGQTIEEELGAAADDDGYEDPSMLPGPSGLPYPEPTTAQDGELPFFVRNLVKEVVSGENDQNSAGMTLPKSGTYDMEDGGDYEMEEGLQIPSESSAFAPPASNKVPPRKIAKTMDALLGQANLEYARGNIREALQILLEVIRTDPRNASAYQQVSDMYTECGDKAKSLQYGLLAAHLNPKTPADMWVRWGDLSTELNLMDEAAACYGRAIKLDIGNFEYYQKRIHALDQLQLRPLAMRMRLQAMQEIHNNGEVSFQWFQDNIRKVASYFIGVNDEDKAITCLEIFITRSREFGEDASSQHEKLLGMLLDKGRYLEASRSILALVDGIRVVHSAGELEGHSAIEVFFIGGVYFVRPYPPPEGVHFIVEDEFPTIMLARLVVCFLGMHRKDLAEPLKEILLARDLSDLKLEPQILDVAKAYYSPGNYKICKNFIEHFEMYPIYNACAELHFIYGNALSALNQLDNAAASFETCLSLLPTHVDARINLADLQLKSGNTELALKTLQGYDLDACSNLPDERLLIQQADVLFEEKKIDQFIRCVRMLLTPHFYEVHRNPEVFAKRRYTKNHPGLQLSNTLRLAALNVIQNTPWEKFIRRLGCVSVNEGRNINEITATMLHDYCLKLLECLIGQERYQDALIVCAYAFLQPKITKTDKCATFRDLLYFCAIKAHSWALAFEFIRWFHANIMNSEDEAAPQLHKRIFNAMNYVFCHSQNVCYHRYIMRALTKSPGNHALQAISGNNSLITGTYRHALGEYLQVWHQNQNNPLMCLLLALTFTHMSCKKDLSSRHMIALRGIAFMKKYEKVRACQQEVWYNIARMFHQMSIFPLAIHFYEKVLSLAPPTVVSTGPDGNEVVNDDGKYDLRPFAAHNLALIYRTSGNDYLARQIYENYLSV